MLARDDLSIGRRDEMFELLVRHFDGVSRTQFEQDLAEKNWVILLTRGPRLVGFSTLLAYESTFDGQPVSVIYSGDTIVAPEAWGTTILSRAWIACVRQLRERYPRGKYYWLFLTSGFRTYRFLPVFWREFYPRFDTSMPPGKKRLVDHLAQERLGSQYSATDGIVRFTNPQKLRENLREIPEGRTSDPHIAFFISQNPGHALGDELVCLTELSDENLTPAGRRMVKSYHYESCCDHC
ncbi:MAG TPA: hypothetical protein VGI03_01450 [Verrucomicrobiae bacterium]